EEITVEELVIMPSAGTLLGLPANYRVHRVSQRLCAPLCPLWLCLAGFLPRPVPMSSRSLRKQFDEHNARDKSSHVRPESHPAACLAGVSDGGRRPAQEIQREPVPQR